MVFSTQAIKDTARETVRLNGVQFAGEGKLAHFLSAVRAVSLSAGMGMEQAETVSRRLLCSTSRTSSGADTYFLLKELFEQVIHTTSDLSSSSHFNHPPPPHLTPSNPPFRIIYFLSLAWILFRLCELRCGQAMEYNKIRVEIKGATITRESIVITLR